MTWPSLVSFSFDRGFKDVFNSKTDRKSGISGQRRDPSSSSHDWTKIFLEIRAVRFLVRTQERRWRKWYVKDEFGVSWRFQCRLRCNAAAVRWLHTLYQQCYHYQCTFFTALLQFQLLFSHGDAVRKAETLQGCGCKPRRTQEAFSPQIHKPIRIHSVKARALPRTLFSVSQNLGIKPSKRLQGAVVSVSAIGYWAEVAVYEMRLTSEVLQLLIRFVFWGCT
jgi:hypothetical protein